MDPNVPILKIAEHYDRLHSLSYGMGNFYESAHKFFIHDRRLPRHTTAQFRYKSFAVPRALYHVWFPDERKVNAPESFTLELVSALEKSLKIKPSEKIIAGHINRGVLERHKELEAMVDNSLAIIDDGVYVAWDLDRPFGEEGHSHLVAVNTKLYSSHDRAAIALVSGDVDVFFKDYLSHVQCRELKTEKPLQFSDFGKVSSEILQNQKN